MLLAFALACASASAPALSTSTPSEDELAARADALVADLPPVEAYLRERSALLQQAKAGEHGRIRVDEMNRLVVAERTMAKLLRGRESALELDKNQRVELFNAQEVFTAVLGGTSGDDLVCERIQKTGSRLKTTICKTRWQRDQERRAAQDDLTHHGKRIPPPVQGQ
jgi:hypothetical protein